MNGEEEYRLHFNETDEQNEEQPDTAKKPIPSFQNMLLSG